MSTNETSEQSRSPIEQIPEDNPFRDQLETLRQEGLSWTEVWERLDAAYRPVDRAAFDEGRGRQPTEGQCTSAVGHNWETVTVGIKGRGSLTTEKVEGCTRCEAVRVNGNVNYIGKVDDD